MRLACAIALLLAALWDAEAAALELKGDFVQGGMLRGLVAPGTEVRFLGRRVRVSENGRFVVGFGRDFGPKAELTLVHADGRRQVRALAIAKRSYQTQRIDGLPPKMVTPPPEVLARIRRENALIAAARARDTAAEWFAQVFLWPARGVVTGVYGSQRILNGKPRRPHYGIDIAAPKGTPVRAPASGRVGLAETDLYYTGGTVLLDHGHGLTSIFLHLETLAVRAGDEVARGAVIGSVGASGRATGPHLDWRINWFDQRLDPALVAGPMPSAQ